MHVFASFVWKMTIRFVITLHNADFGLISELSVAQRNPQLSMCPVTFCSHPRRAGRAHSVPLATSLLRTRMRTRIDIVYVHQ